VLISLNLRFFCINMPFAVHWNPYGAKKKLKILTNNGIFRIFERFWNWIFYSYNTKNSPI